MILLVAALAGSLGAAAAPAATGQSITVISDGTGQGTAAGCPLTGPGGDNTSTDGVVCTNDSFVYGWNFNSGTGGSTQTFTQTLPPGPQYAGITWDPSDVKLCAPSANNGATSASGSISPDGKTLTCTFTWTGVQVWDGTLPMALNVNGTVPNGTTLAPVLTVSGNPDPARNGDFTPPTITVRAEPLVDLRKTMGVYIPSAVYQGQAGVIVRVSASGLQQGNEKGMSALASPITFDDDLSGMPAGATLIDPTCFDPASVPPPSAGTWSCTQTAPGQPVHVTITGATTTGSAGATPSNTAFSGFFDLFIPSSSLSATPTLAQDQLKGFDPNDASGASNFGAGFEPGGAPGDTCTSPANNNNCAATTLTAPSGSGTDTVNKVLLSSDPGSPLLPGTTVNGQPVALVTPGQTFVAQVSGFPSSSVAHTGYYLCDKWNPTQQQLVAGKPITVGVSQNYVIEYTDHAFASATDSCGVAGDATTNGPWVTNPNQLAGGLASVTAVRVIISDVATLAAGSFVNAQLPMIDLSTQPGTLVSDDGQSNWTNGTQLDQPATYVVTSNVLRLQKTALNNANPPQPTGSAQAGANVHFQVTPHLVAPSATALTVVDKSNPCYSNATLLPSAQADWTMTVQPGNPGPDQLFCTADDVSGETLTFTSTHPITPGSEPPIDYTLYVSPTVKDNTTLVNQAEISAEGNQETPDHREASASVLIRAASAISMFKEADKPQVEVDPDQIGFTVQYANNSSNDVGRTQWIDVLPYVGDGRGTSFAGQLHLLAATPLPNSTVTVEYTSAAPGSINSDPNATSNSDGTTPWCTQAQLGTANCPADIGSATALRLTVPDFQAGMQGGVHLGMQPRANHGGDVYDNNVAAGRAAGLSLPIPTSNIVTVNVVASSIGDTVWWDYNANGVQDAGEPGIPGVTVTLKDSAGNVLGTTTTDANGVYHFSDLHSGKYQAVVTPPAGASATYDLDNGTTSPNSDSGLFDLGVHVDRTDVDFGYRAQAAIATTTSSTSLAPGQSVTDRVTVTGDTTGSYQPTVYGPVAVPASNNCADVLPAAWAAATPTNVGPAVTNPAAAFDTAAFTPTQPGCYSWGGVFTGAHGNNGAQAAGDSKEIFTVALNQPTVATAVGVAVVSVGDSITDVVSVSGLGAGNSAGLSWEVRGPLPVGANNSCAGLDWSSAASVAGSGATPLTVSDGQVTIGDGSTTPVITVGAAGCYAFREVLAATLTTASSTSDFGAANEQVLVNPRVVGLSTNISSASVTPGQTVTDTINLTNAGGLPVTVNWTLVGPVAAPASGDCSTVDWSRAPATPVDSGTVSIPAGSSSGTTVASKPLALPGCYSYTDQIVGSSAVAAKTVGAGADFEMVLVGAVSPSLSTSISQTSGQPPVTVHDTVSVSGTLENTTAHSTLYGPVAAPAGGCAAVTQAQWQAAGKLTQDVSIPAGPAVQQVKTADVSLGAAGCYSYGDVLDATTTSNGQTLNPGDPSETITVAANVPQIDTQISAATVAAGGQVQDTITPSNTGGAAVDVAWALLGPVAPVNGSCATVDWSSAPATPVSTGTVTNVAAGSSGTTPLITVTAAGCYSFTTSIAADPAKGLAAVSEPAGRPNEFVQVTAGQPVVSTTISATTGKPGDQVHDSITVTGLLQNSTVHSTLYGPVAVPASGNCADLTVAQWKAAAAQPVEDFPAPAGSTTPITTANTTLSSPGCYSYGDVLDATTSSQATTLNPGNPTETIKVDPFAAAFSTQVTSAAITSGAQAQDTVMVGNAGRTEVDVAWTLVGPVAPVNGACTAVDWSTAPAAPVDSGTAKVLAGQSSAQTSTTTLTAPGCYSYTDSFAGNATVAAFNVAAGAANEVIQVNKSQPTIGTTISQTSGTPDVGVTDTVHVSGLVQAASLTSTLYGPVTPPAAGTCADITLAQWQAAATFQEQFQASAPTASITTAQHGLHLPGCYSYGDALAATATSNAATINPGDPLETIFVDANQPGLTTHVSQAQLSSGQSVTDTIDVTNTGSADVDVTWNLVGPVAPVNGSCATVAWSTLLPAPNTVASGVVTIKAGQGEGVTPATTVTLPGCYSFTESIGQTATTKPVILGAGAANEVVQVTALHPGFSTAISAGTGLPGTTVYDNVGVSGTNGARTTVTWTLVGPVAAVNGKCPAQGDPAWSGAAQVAAGTIAVNGDGTYVTDGPAATPRHGEDTLAAVGCYSYADTLNADAQGTITAATIAAGDPGETAQITPFQPQLTTTAQASSALAGASLTDTVTITGLGSATPTMTWQLLGPLQPVTGSCANLDWTAAAVAGTGTVQTVAGTTQYPVGPTVVPQAGCYTYVEDLPATALSDPAHSAAGQAVETVLLNPYNPTVTTKADGGKDPKLGDKVHDSITVTGFGPAANSADVSWTLLGPVVPAKGTSCAGIDWSSPSIPVAATGTITVSADGTYQSADVTIARVGCYSYADALAATTGSTAAVLAAGDPTETLYVRALTKALTLHKLVKKSVNSGTFIEADSSDHRSGAYQVGETVTWKIVVTNTGEDVLHGVTVTDEQVKDCATSIGDLQPGAVAYFTCTSKAQGPMVNLAVATDRTKQAHDQNSARILVTTNLAVTGTDVVPMVIGGALALLVGLLLLLAARRRRES